MKEPPKDKMQHEVKCGANWQLILHGGNLGVLKCRHCGVYVTEGGTPKCLKNQPTKP